MNFDNTCGSRGKEKIDEKKTTYCDNVMNEIPYRCDRWVVIRTQNANQKKINKNNKEIPMKKKVAN